VGGLHPPGPIDPFRDYLQALDAPSPASSADPAEVSPAAITLIARSDDRQPSRAVCRADDGNPAEYRGIELARIHRVMAFDEVYTEFQPKIQRFLCRLVGPDDAEDLTQEVFLKVSKALPEFRGDSTLSTWIYRIASNSALDRLRGRTSRGLLEVPLTSELRPTDRLLDGEHRVFRREMRQCLDRFIEKLPPNYRSVFVLSEYEELTNPEIAAALGISLAAVKIRMHRARQLLQVELHGRCRFSRDARNELVCEPKSSPVSVHG
jgi:RNA polymerase sigma-70 factor, ECF subfamily